MHSVTILMSTYNGEKYIREQIDSLIKQKNVDIAIFVRDDGSSDSTIQILKEYETLGVLKWYTGPNLRPARSFLNLIQNAPNSEYYAFCDQDDVWSEDKLERAIAMLEKHGDNTQPRLYCANYQLVDAELRPLPDNGHVSTTTFPAALVSSCCTGCTTVFNKALLNILKMGEPETIVMHDDWAHKVCLAVGGTVDYDETKVLKYRQHGNNADGGVHTKSQKIRQILNRMCTKDLVRSKQIAEIPRMFSSLMSDEYIKMCDCIGSYYNNGFIARFKLMFNRSLITPYKRLNCGFRIAVLFRYF